MDQTEVGGDGGADKSGGDGEIENSGRDGDEEKSEGDGEIEQFGQDGEFEKSGGDGELKKSKSGWWRKISVEPATFFFGLAYALVGVQVSNLYIEKTCKVGSFFFGNGTTFSDEICNNLFNGTFQEEQKMVQAVSAQVEMVRELLKQIPVLIFALFVGPWSDRVGRKLLIMMPYVGLGLYCLVFIINVYFFEELVVEFLWFESISSFFGGFLIFLIGAYGYLADTSSPSSRTMRIAIMDGMFTISEFFGQFINGYIFAYLGYYGNFGLGIGVCFVGFLLVFFTFDGSNKSAASVENSKKTHVYSLKNVLESFKVLVKPRGNNLRHIVVLLVCCFQIWSVVGNGMWYIEYFYIRRKFDWTDENYLVTWYTQLRAYSSGAQIISVFVILPFFIKVLKLRDMTIVMIATLSIIAKCFLFIFSDDKIYLYGIIACSLFDSLCTQPLRSSMTKLVGPGDVGKIFACVGSLQAITGFASPIYNILYISTMDTFIGSVYAISAGIFGIQLILLGYIYFFLKRKEKKEKSASSNQQEMTQD